MQLYGKVKDILSDLGQTPETFTGRILLCRCSTTFPVERKTMKNNAWQMLKSYTFIRPGSEKKWHSMKEDSPQGIWDNIAEKMLLEFAESGCPIFRATTPLSRGQLRSKEHGKLSIHYCAT